MGDHIERNTHIVEDKDLLMDYLLWPSLVIGHLFNIIHVFTHYSIKKAKFTLGSLQGDFTNVNLPFYP